ncbi:hypothetical protein HW132_32175 [Brasilonema sp. CT11]|nr:hypothetical protein [Brasilonema sp. CT11]
MSTLSIRNHPFSSWVWERIREEGRVFFSLSAPINRTRFWVYPIIWFGGYWFVLFLILTALDRINFSGLDIDDSPRAFLLMEISATFPLTLALLIPSIKRLKHMKKPTWLAWSSVALLFIPYSFSCYDASIEIRNMYNDWLNVFANKQFYTFCFTYAYRFAPLGLLAFILYLGIFPINYKKIYQNITKNLARISY